MNGEWPQMKRSRAHPGVTYEVLGIRVDVYLLGHFVKRLLGVPVDKVERIVSRSRNFDQFLSDIKNLQ
jgi:hypothetical protein